MFNDIAFTDAEYQLIKYLEEQRSKKQLIQASFKNDLEVQKKYKKLFRKPKFRKFLEEIRKDIEKNK